MRGRLITPQSDEIHYFKHELFLDGDNLRLTGWESKKKVSTQRTQ